VLNLCHDLAYRLRRAPGDTGVSPPEPRARVEGPDVRRRGGSLDIGCGTGSNAVCLAAHGWGRPVSTAWKERRREPGRRPASTSSSAGAT